MISCNPTIPYPYGDLRDHTENIRLRKQRAENQRVYQR